MTNELSTLERQEKQCPRVQCKRTLIALTLCRFSLYRFFMEVYYLWFDFISICLIDIDKMFLTGMRRRLRPHKVYTFFGNIKSRADIAMSVSLFVSMKISITETYYFEIIKVSQYSQWTVLQILDSYM